MLIRTFCLVVSAVVPAMAQTALTGAVQGAVTDAVGGALVRAGVELTSESLGFKTTQTTGSLGSFRF